MVHWFLYVSVVVGGGVVFGFFWGFFATGMTFQNAVLCLSTLENANRREKSPEEPDLLDLFSLTFNHSIECDISVIPNYYTLVLWLKHLTRLYNYSGPKLPTQVWNSQVWNSQALCVHQPEKILHRCIFSVCVHTFLS